MPLSTEVHEEPIRVRYAETDAAGIAHHAAYLPWLEVGRVAWLRAQGLSYAALEREGYTLPVVELELRYVAPVRFDDIVVVRVALGSLRSRDARFTYELVTDEANPRQVANGHTRHLCLQRGQVVRMPPALRALVADG